MFLALRRRREYRAALTAERAFDLGAGKERAELAVAVDHGQPVEHAAERRPVDHFLSGAAIPSGNLHCRIIECARKTQAAAHIALGRDGKIDEWHRPEFAVDLA